MTANVREIIYLQISISFTITLIGCLFLFLKADSVRSRRILAWIMGLWAVNFAIRLIGPLFHVYPIAKEVYWSPLFLIVGPFLALLLLWYVIELIRPGWINWRRAWWISLPWLTVSAIYPIGLWLLDEPYIRLQRFSDLTGHITEFNVWYRFILFVMSFAYIYWLNKFALRYRYYYDKWCIENYASTEQMDISWLRYIAGGLLVVTILYSCMLFNLGLEVWILHQIAMQSVLLTAFYYGLYHRNPYTEQFFEQTMDETGAQQLFETSHTRIGKDDNNFADHLPGYIEAVETWMQTSKPHLRSDFKLLDVSEILPLNRSYLSRVFNEGFGSSFCQFVQNRRMEKARELLLCQQQLTIKEITYECGFSSTSAFHATFREKTGMTPSQFRQQASRPTLTPDAVGEPPSSPRINNQPTTEQGTRKQ